MRLESAIIRLIELQLYLIDWRPNAVLLKTNSFRNGLFKWLDIYVIWLNSHFMQIGCSFFMNDMIFLILVKRRVSQRVGLIILTPSELGHVLAVWGRINRCLFFII